MSRPATTEDASDCFGLAGTELESRYRVERVVAEGGFGVVYAGYDQRLKVPVAIKVLKPDEALSEAKREAFAAQFVREARTVARLRHPAIVAVQNLGVAETPSGVKAPWMALEWLEGRTLKEELLRRGDGRRMSPREALALLRPVLDAVAHAHEEGFAHRDLKPANIMLVPTRRGDAPYVLDFGVAKAVALDDKAGPGETSTEGLVSGFTATYAAPEQVSGTRTGPWTDVHALGLIFVELILGRRPYEGHDRAALFTRALAERRPTPARFGVDVGPLEPVLARAVALRPDERFATARELLDALDAAVAAPPPRDAASPRRTWALAAIGFAAAAGVVSLSLGGAPPDAVTAAPAVTIPALRASPDAGRLAQVSPPTPEAPPTTSGALPLLPPPATPQGTTTAVEPPAGRRVRPLPRRQGEEPPRIVDEASRAPPPAPAMVAAPAAAVEVPPERPAAPDAAPHPRSINDIP